MLTAKVEQVTNRRPGARGIHLDFHNAPSLPDIGRDFDAQEFANTVTAANVDSVTLFAKCHHGLSYYPTEVGRMHPSLDWDLLGAQIDALHSVGVRTPIYMSVGWDEAMADRHPEWRQVDRNGRMVGKGPLDVDGWRMLDLASPYADYVLDQTEEVLRRYRPVDGIFFDIVRQEPEAGFSRWRLEAQRATGVDESDLAAVAAFSQRVEREFMRRAYTLVKQHSQEATVFFNSRLRPDRDPTAGTRDELAWFTHIEIESLPSVQWDYHHYPLFSAYFQTLGLPVLGMTGIFHKSWADFGGLKPEAALEYECARMLATGASCYVGDQLHPRGTLDAAAYDRIGAVYGRVRELEPWVEHTEAVPEIGVLLAESGLPSSPVGRDIDEGAMRMLMEQHRSYQFVDRDADLTGCRVLVAPDDVPFDAKLARKVRDYLEGGGALLASGRAGPGAEGESFALDFGVDYVGPSPMSPEYVVGTEAMGEALRNRGQVLYEPGVEVRPHPGTEVLAWLGDPYFTRTHDRYTSHRHAPYDRTSGRPAVTRRGRVVYCANPLFAAYRRHAVPYYRELVDELLDQLAPDRLVDAPGLPTTAEVTVMRQRHEGNRVIVHVVHAVPQRRGRDIDIVEDVLPLYEVRLGVRVDGEVTRVYLAPGGALVPHETVAGRTWVTVPEVRLHQVIVFE